MLHVNKHDLTDLDKDLNKFQKKSTNWVKQEASLHHHALKYQNVQRLVAFLNFVVH